MSEITDALDWLDSVEDQEKSIAKLISGFSWNEKSYEPSPVFATIRKALLQQTDTISENKYQFCLRDMPKPSTEDYFEHPYAWVVMEWFLSHYDTLQESLKIANHKEKTE